MTQTDGEHELVLGNKQLLSLFFVVVALMGVSAGLGYLMGKNSATAGFNAGQPIAGGTRPDAAGRPVDNGFPTASVPPPDSTSPAVDPNSAATPAPPPPAAPLTDTRPETRTEAKTAPPIDAPPARTETLAQPSSEEMYLQVSAVRRPDADNMVKLLRERGFPALLGESSKQGLFRVLVGPYKTHTEMGKVKTDLKAKGFDSIVAK